MNQPDNYLQLIFQQHAIQINSNRMALFQDFKKQSNILLDVQQISNLQQRIMKSWELHQRVADIKAQGFSFPNGSVGKLYLHQIDMVKLQLEDIDNMSMELPSDGGLIFDAETKLITGIPTISGDLVIKVNFTLKDQPDTTQIHQKTILLIINPDPKTLWKNIPSPTDGRFPKADNQHIADVFLDKRIVVSSKRGRSHANVGSARDDDFSYHNYEDGWSIIAVSDGAGSAKFSREGSRLACTSIVSYFESRLKEDEFKIIDGLVVNFAKSKDAEVGKQINQFVYKEIGNAALHTHKVIDAFAVEEQLSLKELHATFIFCLVKKYEMGYVIMSFCVGDCPIAVLNKEVSEVKMLNQLDVGEYGGGTRFITMPEIFESSSLPQRFGFKLIDDFSYLMLMTDGIYDPKFVTEANLEKIEKWTSFIADLEGDNADGNGLSFDYGNAGIDTQLSSWMDFWESGNHDDRTLAIIY
jgi:serine/threonine protein phosphatase PrpC